MDSLPVTQIYEKRFSEKENDYKNRIWHILCDYFFSKFIPLDSTIIDIGGGYCEFINNIKAKKKIVIDIDPNTNKYKAEDVIFVNSSCFQIDKLNLESADIVFISNFLEHLNSKEEIVSLFQKVRTILKQNGSLLILGPNIKYLSKDYWDFFDHKIPLSHLSIIEILKALNFKIEKVYKKFIPYTTKSRYIRFYFLIKLYLKIPFFYSLFGKQFFVLSKKI